MPGRLLITHHVALTTYYSTYLGDARGLGGGEGGSQGRGGDGAHAARVEDVVCLGLGVGVGVGVGVAVETERTLHGWRVWYEDPTK